MCKEEIVVYRSRTVVKYNVKCEKEVATVFLLCLPHNTPVLYASLMAR